MAPDEVLLSNKKYSCFPFFFSPWKHMLWYSFEVPHLGTSNEYPQHMFSWRNKKNIYVTPHLIWSNWLLPWQRWADRIEENTILIIV